MRILTGVQPSGIPHLGNYFGAMKQVCALQDRGESFLFIADYHALTTSPDPKVLRQNVVNLALDKERLSRMIRQVNKCIAILSDEQ